MAEIVIHNCTLRLVRRGNWSWGGDPKGLLKAAVAILPEMIARALSGLWPEDADLEIAAPLRVTVPLRLADLLASPTREPDEAFEAGGRHVGLPTGVIENAIRAAFQAASSFTASDDAQATDPPAPAGEVAPAGNATQGGTLLKVLLSWREAGTLESTLSTFSEPSLTAWHRRLLPLQAAAPAEDEILQKEIVALVQAVLERGGDLKSDRPGRIRLQMMAAVEVAATLGLTPQHPAVPRVLNQLLPIGQDDTPPAASPDAQEERGSAPPGLPGTPGHRFARGGSGSRGNLPVATSWDLRVPSALPFLLLGPLSQIGYLDTLTAVAESSGLADGLATFATALAYKVLDPPKKGWYREPSMVAAATAFSGLQEGVPHHELAELARRMKDHLSPLDGLLSGALAAGHDPAHPLLLRRVEEKGESGYLLADVEGLFPIGWVTQLEEIYPLLRRFGRPVVLLPQQSAGHGRLAELDRQGVTFITDAPPTRGERWRRLRQHRGVTCWTNDFDSAEGLLANKSQDFSFVVEEIDDLTEELVQKRASIPLADSAALEQSVTLAAAVALGTIGWTLWRERERVVPQLALQRFHDLDAHLFFDRDAVRVRLPLGRRYQDLFEHGLLADVTNVPWLGERVVHFSAG
jgi:hypothetical protein